jgi:hypothetical protein
MGYRNGNDSEQVPYKMNNLCEESECDEQEKLELEDGLHRE